MKTNATTPPHSRFTRLLIACGLLHEAPMPAPPMDRTERRTLPRTRKARASAYFTL